MDSGASRHICSSANAFISMQKLQDATVTLPNGTIIHVDYVGDIQMHSDLLLRQVLYVPQFKFNLLSVSALTGDSQLVVHFHHSYFIIQEVRTNMMIGRGDRIGDLYILDPASYPPTTTSFASNVSVSIWHQRLGHPSFKILEPLQKQLKVDHLLPHHKELCHICPFAKQLRSPFTSHNKLSVNPFDLVHCDIWGPYQEFSHSGHHYFLTLVDDCTRFTWTFLLVHKSDVSRIVPNFFTMIETQFHRK